MASSRATPAVVSSLSLTTRGRPFSSTSCRSRINVPPESPLYITVPTPPQSSEERLAPVRGHLPIPRQIFKQRGGQGKVASDFVARTLPKSRAQALNRKPRSDVQARKWDMADSRRQALTEGIKGLWERSQTWEEKRRAESALKFKRNRQAAMRPDALDDVLTRSTILGATIANTEVKLDPLRFERAEQAREALAEKLAKKSNARQDALARLYAASADFIVDEAELEARVHDTFDNPKYLNTTVDKTDSQWGFGPPISVAQMIKLREVTGVQESRKTSVTNARQQEIADELLGGKLE